MKARYIRKCECCNKRLKKVIRYECRTDGCINEEYDGVMLSDIEVDKIPSDITMEEQEYERQE